jgi:hypothetical protein
MEPAQQSQGDPQAAQMTLVSVSLRSANVANMVHQTHFKSFPIQMARNSNGVPLGNKKHQEIFKANCLMNIHYQQL